MMGDRGRDEAKRSKGDGGVSLKLSVSVYSMSALSLHTGKERTEERSERKGSDRKLENMMERGRKGKQGIEVKDGGGGRRGKLLCIGGKGGEE